MQRFYQNDQKRGKKRLKRIFI